MPGMPGPLFIRHILNHCVSMTKDQDILTLRISNDVLLSDTETVSYTKRCTGIPMKSREITIEWPEPGSHVKYSLSALPQEFTALKQFS